MGNAEIVRAKAAGSLTASSSCELRSSCQGSGQVQKDPASWPWEENLRWRIKLFSL
jgi:hypothetical protein